MSLIKCPGCSHHISELETNCPNCDFLLTEELVRKIRLEEKKDLEKKLRKAGKLAGMSSVSPYS